MAYPSDPRLCSPRIVRCILALVIVFLVLVVVGRPVMWHLRDRSYTEALCLPCDCDCVSEILSTPLGFVNRNSSYSDCAKNDPEMTEEMEKSTITLLKEELSLHKNVSEESLRRTMVLITGAKRTSSHYQKEAEKCTAGMETCEEAREKSEAALSEELKLSAIWEERAREYGWQDDSSL